MYISELSIKRPVLATVMSLVIVLLGVIAFQRLSVREYPNIDAPVVSVRTVYKGASAPVMESQVTQPLEDSLSGIEGVKSIKSVSREEVSQITVEFVRERDSDAAASDVRDRVSRVRARLPTDIDEPVVSKIEADAQAIMWLAFRSDRHTPLEITDYADRYIADSIKTLPGVSSVIIGGERQVRDAALARPRPPRGLCPHAAGRGGRAQTAERRDPRRAHRGRQARVHGAVRDRSAHARAVQQPDRRRGERLPGAAARTSAAPSSARSTTATRCA